LDRNKTIQPVGCGGMQAERLKESGGIFFAKRSQKILHRSEVKEGFLSSRNTQSPQAVKRGKGQLRKCEIHQKRKTEKDNLHKEG